MDEKEIRKNNKIKKIPKSYENKKISKLKNNKYSDVSHSFFNKIFFFTNDSIEMSKDFTKGQNNKPLKATYKEPIKRNKNKKIYIKIQQKRNNAELHNSCIKNKKKKIKNINLPKTRNKNKGSKSDIINRSYGDNPIVINKPRKTNNYFFNNFQEKKLNISLPCPINFNNLLDFEENVQKSNNDINNKMKKYNISEYSCDRNSRRFQDKLTVSNSNINGKLNNERPQNSFLFNSFWFNNHGNCSIIEEDNILDDFFKKKEKIIDNNNNELFRFSNINNNLNDDNFNSKRISNYFNHFINSKIEKIEVNENHQIKDFISDKNFEKELMNIDKKFPENKNDNLVSVPCMNCGKIINISDIDDHSIKCFKIKEESVNLFSNDDSTSIEIKLKNIYEYLSEQNKNQNSNINIESFDFIEILKKNVKEILNIKTTSQISLEKLKKINKIISELFEKNVHSTNKTTLLNRLKILIDKKIEYMQKELEAMLKIENNLNKNDNKSNNLKNMTNIQQNNNYLYHENISDDLISESETTENFDLKNMEKILDEKRELKSNNLDNVVNEAKNKRLFLMEVLKVKYQKINQNKEENLIPPIMIWKEAMKKKIKMKEWSKFIFDELSNPGKYIKIMEKRKGKTIK